MNSEYLGMTGAILGSVLGIAGGIFGTWCSIRATRGSRERAFMIRAAVVTWIVALAFVAGLLLLPQPYNYLLWIPYPVVLVSSILWMNRRQAQIRAQAAADRL